MEKGVMLLLMLFVSLALSSVSGQDAKPCDVGVEKCISAPSRASDSTGEWRCCQAGYSMSSFSSNHNGRRVSRCTCRLITAGNGQGGLYTGSSMFVSNAQGDPTSFDFGAFEKRMRDWSQGLSQKLTQRNPLLRPVSGRLRQMISRISGLSRRFRLWK